MRCWSVFITFSLAASAFSADLPTSDLWNGLQAKREALKSYHQEFDFSITYKYPHGEPHADVWTVTIDGAGRRWRERTVAGSGHIMRIFDGQELFAFEEGDEEYSKPKDPFIPVEDSLPEPYFARTTIDWTKAAEVERVDCQLPNVTHNCVWLNLPIKASMGLRLTLPAWGDPNLIQTVLGGTARAEVDLETGLIIALRAVESIEQRTGSGPTRGSYQADLRYTLKRMSFGLPSSQNLFRLPANHTKEVKVLRRWDADKINHDLAGSPAPELFLTDWRGQPISLAQLKGKAVLLDFWATWCIPCREDIGALNKLAEKHNQKDLVILGLSVNEDRAVVEQYLDKHPHSFNTVITAENDLPRVYRARFLPTYIVIGKDGTLISAATGYDKLAEVYRLLKRAGVESK